MLSLGRCDLLQPRGVVRRSGAASPQPARRPQVLVSSRPGESPSGRSRIRKSPALTCLITPSCSSSSRRADGDDADPWTRPADGGISPGLSSLRQSGGGSGPLTCRYSGLGSVCEITSGLCTSVCRYIQYTRRKYGVNGPESAGSRVWRLTLACGSATGSLQRWGRRPHPPEAPRHTAQGFRRVFGSRNVLPGEPNRACLDTNFFRDVQSTPCNTRPSALSTPEEGRSLDYQCRRPNTDG
jgi:hypothetical protein